MVKLREQPEVRIGPSVRVGEGKVKIWAEVGQPTGTEVGCRQGTGGQSRPGEAGVTGESLSAIGWGQAGRSPAG